MLKIAEAVRFVFLTDPDVQIANDDIVFESLSDKALELLHEYMFPKAESTIEYDDGIELSITNSDDDDCVVVSEPLMHLYFDKWSTKFICNNNTTLVDDLTEIAPLKRITDFGTTKKMVFNVHQRSDGNFVIQLPQENISRRDSIIISEDLMSKLCSSLWTSSGNEVISNKLY